MVAVLESPPSARTHAEQELGRILANRMSTPSALPAASPQIAIVVIGRNEGERLRRCLQSLQGKGNLIVYVDSGSSDDSMAHAQSIGVQTLALDLSRPFTAARARNAGFDLAIRHSPEIEFIQFLDGDTEMDPHWMEKASRFMAENARVAAVFGRRRERNPEASIYNQLCDIEWDVPAGATNYCGGDVLVRRKAFEQVRGFSEELIAGEEPDLCVRLRHERWLIHCLDAEMTKHDAAIMHFHQWWKRAVRSGHAFAEGAYRFGAPPDFHWARESQRALLWGLLVPLGVLGLSIFESHWYLLLLLAYPLRWIRVYMRSSGSTRRRVIRASFFTVACFPELAGALQYHYHRLLGRRSSIIEYK